MKKTLFTAALCLGVAASASAALTTYTTTNNDKTSMGGDVTYSGDVYCNGFAVNLNPDLTYSRLETSIVSGSTAFDSTSLTKLTLNTVTTTIRSINNKVAGSTGVYLALTDASHKVLALSTDFATATNASFTWHFPTTTEIGKTDTLYFQYVASTKVAATPDAEGVKVGYTLQATDLVAAGTLSCANYGDKVGADSLYIIGANNQNMTANKQNYAHALTITTTEVVPEPATATLSLLALAGLAARRRRK